MHKLETYLSAISPVPFVLALVIGVSVLLFTNSAEAQTACGPRERVLHHLSEQYRETRQALGLRDGAEDALEVFASLETGTWTILATSPDGLTCILAHGIAFEVFREAPPEHGVIK